MEESPPTFKEKVAESMDASTCLWGDKPLSEFLHRILLCFWHGDALCDLDSSFTTDAGVLYYSPN
jgi:hypothetical protein